VCGSKGSATTTSSYTPPPSVQANYDMLSAQAQQVAATPFTPYTGEMVAGLTPTQQAGIQNVNAAAAEAQPYYQVGAGLVGSSATPFGQQQLNQYMSPYINSVAAATQANLNETNAQQQQQLVGNAISQGAFGGDRAGIAQAELARQQGLSAGQTMANIYQGGYGQALGQFNADQARQLQAGSSLGQLGSGAQTAALSGAQAQLSSGAQQQAVQQAQDVANQQQFQAQQAYPFQTTQYLANLLLGIGGQSGGTSLTSQPGPNIGSQVLGGLTTLASIPWGSDERLKENMEPVGETYDGQKIYKFNYKNDGHTMLGLSAQEVEKHHPDAVHKDGEGMRMVDYEKAVNHAAQRGHFANGGLADSMGGAVHEGGLGRLQYALDGAIPYSDQPSGGSTKPLTLSDVMRISQGLLSQKPGGRSNMPEPPKPYQDTSSVDVAKQLQNATPEQRANMKANIAAINSNLGLGTVAPADVIPVTNYPDQYSMSGMLGRYASGGVVGRHGYAGDGSVQPQDNSDGLLPSQGQSLYEKATGQTLSDNARMGLLSAGLGMLSSRSPFFGVGVGEGAAQGLGTYYNALANQRAYQKQQEELGIQKGRLNIDAMTNAQKMYDDLRIQRSLLGQSGHFDANGEPITPQAIDITRRMDQQRQIIQNLQQGVLGSSILGSPTAVSNSTEPAANAAVDTAKSVLSKTEDKLPAVAPDQSAVVAKPPAVAAPAPEAVVPAAAPAVSPAATPAPDKNAPPAIQTTMPEPQTMTGKQLFAGLPDYANPETLYKEAKAALAAGDGQGWKQKSEEAARISKEITDSGKTIINGEVVTAPGWNEYQKEQKQLPENLKLFSGYGERIMGLQRADMNNDLFQAIGENFEPGILTPLQGKGQALARAIGMEPTGTNAELAANIDRLTKDTNQALFADLKENVGPGQRLLVNEIQGQKQAEPTAVIQPAAYRTLVGQKIGTTKWLQDNMRDALVERQRVGDAKFDEAAFTQNWIDNHPLNDYVKAATLDVAVRGATPTDPSQFVPGQSYIFDKDGYGRSLAQPLKGKFIGMDENGHPKFKTLPLMRVQ